MCFTAWGCLSTRLANMAITSNVARFIDIKKMTNKELLAKLESAGANRGKALSLPSEGKVVFPSVEEALVKWVLYKGSPIVAVEATVDGQKDFWPIYLFRHTALHPVEDAALEAFRAKHADYCRVAWQRGTSDLEWLEPFLGGSYDLSTIDVTETVTRNDIERQFPMRIAALEETTQPSSTRRGRKRA